MRTLLWFVVVVCLLNGWTAGQQQNCQNYGFNCEYFRQRNLCFGSCAEVVNICKNNMFDGYCQRYNFFRCSRWDDGGNCDKYCGRCTTPNFWPAITTTTTTTTSPPCTDLYGFIWCQNVDCWVYSSVCAKTCGLCSMPTPTPTWPFTPSTTVSTTATTPTTTTTTTTTTTPTTETTTPTTETTTPPIEWDTWSECSTTCDLGTQYKVPKCSSNDITTCPKTYQACITRNCSAAFCPPDHFLRYKKQSSCCKYLDGSETCGKGSTFINRKKRSLPPPPAVEDNVDRQLFIATTTVPKTAAIIGGVVAQTWPFMAYLNISAQGEVFRCGGVLIHKRWVLTAAHCVSFITNPTTAIKIILGTSNVEAVGYNVQKVGVASMIVHPNYIPPGDNDIALIKLARVAGIGTFVFPICLPQGEVTPIDERCMAAGWGLTKAYDPAGSDILMEVQLYNLPLDICRKTFPSQNITSSMHLCVGDLRGGKDTCNGDSGGPIYCQRCSSCGWYVAGLTSYGLPDCGKENSGAVYTRVLKHESWIKENVEKLANETFTCG